MSSQHSNESNSVLNKWFCNLTLIISTWGWKFWFVTFKRFHSNPQQIALHRPSDRFVANFNIIQIVWEIECYPAVDLAVSSRVTFPPCHSYHGHNPLESTLPTSPVSLPGSTSSARVEMRFHCLRNFHRGYSCLFQASPRQLLQGDEVAETRLKTREGVLGCSNRPHVLRLHRAMDARVERRR